jgi:hypothetical protein
VRACSLKVGIAAAALLLLCAGVATATALSPPPALALEGWTHDGASPCTVCHDGEPLNDLTCTEACHSGFLSFPGKQCWSCHYPGQDTAPLSTPSAACIQGCHLWDEATKDYVVSFTHGPTPHLGASGYGKACLDCHETSSSFNQADESPHHSGAETPTPTCQACHNGVFASAQVTHDGKPCTACHTGMNLPPVPATCNTCHSGKTFGTSDCLVCHAEQVHNKHPQPPDCTTCHVAGFQRHAGRVACLTCHTGIAAFHHGQSTTTTVKSCRSCHAKKHAGRSVPNAKCATCHKGTGTGPAAKAQHSTNVGKQYVCSTCHSKKLHARALGSGITSCRTCHRSKFHARQRTPANSVCIRCHTAASRHADGFACGVCHRPAIHNARPSARRGSSV